MDKANENALRIVRERLGNKPSYNPVEFLELLAVIIDGQRQLDEAVAEAPKTCPCGCGHDFCDKAIPF